MPVPETPRRSTLGPDFTKLWIASSVSEFGDGVRAVAGALLVASLTSDPLLVSMAMFAGMLPWLLFALVSGALVDRMDRRRVMVVVDATRAAAIGSLGVAVALGRPGLPLIYGVLFLLGVGETLFRAASLSVLPAVVPPQLLERANGRLMMIRMLTGDMLAGPAGGFLFAAAASLPFLVDGASFAVGAVLVAAMHGTFRSPGATPAGPVRASGGAPRRSLFAEISEGLRWLLSHRVLRTMAVLIGLLNVTLVAALSILVLIAKHRLGLGSVGYGLLFTAMAVGGILGGLVGDRLVRWVGSTWTLRVGLLVEAAFHLVIAASSNAYIDAVALAAFGVHGALWTIVTTSLRQRLTPERMLGRVNSAYLFLAAGGNALGALLGGLLASRFGLPAPFWVGFVVAVVVAAATWRVFDRKTMAAAEADAPTVPVPAGNA